MANDDEFIIGGRKSKKSASSQGTPRTTNPRGGGNQSGIKLGTLSGVGQNLREGGTDGAIGGAIGGQMKKVATKADLKDLDVGKAMEKLDNVLTESGAQITGSVAGAIVGSEIRENNQPPPEEDRR